MSTPPPDHRVPPAEAFTEPNPFRGSNPRRLVALSLNTHLPPLSSFTPTKDIGYHPLFQGLLFPWVWRVWTQRFTKAGHYFAVATLFFLAFSGVSLDQQFYVALTYSFGLWAVALLGVWFGRPSVSLSGSYPERARAGDTMALDADITAGRRRAAGLTLLPDRLPPFVDALPEDGAEVPVLTPGETARVRLSLVCRKRGVYRLRGQQAKRQGCLDPEAAQQIFSRPRLLRVAPRFTLLARMDLPHGRRTQPGGTASALRLGDSFEFIGSREYRAGDPVRAIDWRATARLSRPVVREYREEFLQRVALILDTHAPAPPGLPPPPAFESAVSLTAAMSEFVVRSEFAVDVLAAGPDIHTLAGLGMASTDTILDQLAGVEADTRQTSGPDWDTLERRLSAHWGQITLAVCVFLDWDEPRRLLAERLRDTGAGVKVVVVRDTPTTLPPGGVPVLTTAQITAGVSEV